MASPLIFLRACPFKAVFVYAGAEERRSGGASVLDLCCRQARQGPGRQGPGRQAGTYKQAGFLELPFIGAPFCS